MGHSSTLCECVCACVCQCVCVCECVRRDTVECMATLSAVYREGGEILWSAWRPCQLSVGREAR